MSAKAPAKGGARLTLSLGIIVILGIAALIVSVKGTPHKVELPPDSDLRETIVLSVVFTPATRSGNGVEIQAHVETVRVTPPQLFVKTSPWNQSITIPKGAAVALYALQIGSGNLDCLITRDGVTMDHSHRNTAGSIRCYLNRPKP